MRQLFRFMYQHGSHLAFATILMAMSSFGQTYFVSLYGQDLRQAFGLSDGGLGLSLAQALFPLAAVQINYLTGWRIAWLINAVVLIAGVALAVSCLPRAAEKPLRTFRKRGAEKVREASVWKNRNLLLALPAVLASPFITTGFFFHQARLAEEKGWALSWVAGWFIAYAITQAVSLLSFGPLIDRMTPRRLLPWFLLPQGAGMLALWLSSSQWVTPFYLIMTGVSSAIASTLATALWVQLFGSAQLAKVRSAVEAGTVLASGASPVIMGVLIDQHVTLRIQALICLVFILAASLVATRVQVASPEDINS
ncbi:MFS transporter [Pantoea agglomerans]|uniref:MFS transporter n=1 Tax=Enterobacter agglomerans TaxID=549 RepID=UPI0028991042|nr:MFS transporter [Pantoea agglomerans]WNK46571.1 MFS transporter [Pantoea agglomerans]